MTKKTENKVLTSPHYHRYEHLLKHLWKAGQAPNPDGRPKGALNRKTILKQWLDIPAPDGLGGTLQDQLVRTMIANAVMGEHKALTAIFDGLYGKVEDNINIEHKFAKMPCVVRKVDGEGKTIEQALTFEVGSEFNETEQDEDEDDDNERL